MAEGVASVEDVDTAVSAGPGALGGDGPHMLFNLGAGEGGMAEFRNRYADSFHRWWDDLGNPRLTPEIGAILDEGLKQEADGRSLTNLAQERDRVIIAALSGGKQPFRCCASGLATM